jgi:hypothetical protein
MKPLREKRPELHPQEVDEKYPSIPKAQLELPAGYDSHGRSLTLRQVLQSPPGVVSPTKTLDAKSRLDLVLDRLQAKPSSFRIGVLGHGPIDRDTAIKEVEKNSEIGQVIQAIELRILKRVLDAAQSADGKRDDIRGREEDIQGSEEDVEREDAVRDVVRGLVDDADHHHEG